MTSERIEVQRTIAAEPAAIFKVLCNPKGQVSLSTARGFSWTPPVTP